MTLRALISKKPLASLTAALAILVPATLFLKLAAEVRERQSPQLDTAVLIWLHHSATPTLDRIATLLTDLGGPGVIIGVTLISAIVLYLKHRRRAMTMLLLGVGGAAIINLVLKTAFQRVRPELWVQVVTEKSFSFPSGHAMASSALALTVILMLWHTRLRYPALILGTLYIGIIGLTRLYLGVHYPTDVLGGWLVSFIWVFIVHSVLTRAHIHPNPKAQA
jgi:membrane-associated phospholipid phosphatase